MVHSFSFGVLVYTLEAVDLYLALGQFSSDTP